MAKKKTAARKTSGRKAAGLEDRVKALERRLQELTNSPLFALADVLVLEKGKGCTTVKVIGNLQIVNGKGKTDSTNGCGNLIIGYNEASTAPGSPTARSGSHNLVLGRFHSHATYGCLLAGEKNAALANASSSCLAGGSEGSASARFGVVVGGFEGKANSDGCVVIGGFDNGANNAARSVVVGGTNNRADAPGSCVFGGSANTTSSAGSTILGGSNLSTTTPGQRIP